MTEKYNTLSIVAFIFMFIIAPVGLILGIIALSQIKKTNEKGKGLALAAVIVGIISLVVIIVVILSFILYHPSI